jgi:hypothetical protein
VTVHAVEHRLVSLDWGRLQAWRARLATPLAPAAVVREAAREARPSPTSEDLATLTVLEAAGAPPGLVARRGLRVDPPRYVEAAVASLPGSEAERLLLDLARVDTLDLDTNPDVLLAYCSPVYRRAVTGVEPSGGGYDGDPSLPAALGWSTAGGVQDGAVHPPGEVAAIAAALSQLRVDDYPAGNVRPLLDFIEATLDPDFRAHGLTLLDEVALALDVLTQHYVRAAQQGHGMLCEPSL